MNKDSLYYQKLLRELKKLLEKNKKEIQKIRKDKKDTFS